MKVLVPIEDLFTRDDAAAALFRLAVPAHPHIAFFIPSRGPDLRAAARNALPSNVVPFAVDRSPELRDIARAFAAEENELEFATQVAAAAVSLRGLVLDAVDVPSSHPVAHLVRPVFAAVGVGVGAVVGADLGGAGALARDDWPDPAPEKDATLARAEARSTAALEMRYALVTRRGTEACGIVLPLTALFGGRRGGSAEASPAGALAFAGLPRGASGVGRFLALAAGMPERDRRDCLLPHGPAPLQRTLRALAARLGIRIAADGTAVAAGIAPSLRDAFDPAPLDMLRRGIPVLLSESSWTASALAAEGLAHLAPHRFDPSQPEAAAEALRQLLAAPPPRIPAWPEGGSPATGPRPNLCDVYGARSAPAGSAGAGRRLPAASIHAVLAPTAPSRAAVRAPEVVAIATTGPAAAAGTVSLTLASLARQHDIPIEAIVADAGADAAETADAVAAAGGWVRLLRLGPQGAAAAANHALRRASAPAVCLLPTGAIVAEDLFAAAQTILATDDNIAAVVPAWAKLRGSRPSPAIRPEGFGLGTVASDAEAWLAPALVLRRAAVLASGGLDTTLGRWAPLDLLFRLVARGGAVATLPAPVRAWAPGDAPLTDTEDAELRRVLSRAAGPAYVAV